eukprot:38758-Prymnesium_polylepis.1
MAGTRGSLTHSYCELALSMCEVTRLLARHCPVAGPGCRSLREPAPTLLLRKTLRAALRKSHRNYIAVTHTFFSHRRAAALCGVLRRESAEEGGQRAVVDPLAERHGRHAAGLDVGRARRLHARVLDEALQ